MVYIASEVALPVRVTPEMHVRLIEPDQSPIRQWFSQREVRLVGAHTGCSCGFPSLVADRPIEYYEGRFEDTDERAQDLASVSALFALIDEALSRSEMIELFPVWAGNEPDAPASLIQVSRATLDPRLFFFTEHFLYRITA